VACYVDRFAYFVVFSGKGWFMVVEVEWYCKLLLVIYRVV